MAVSFQDPQGTLWIDGDFTHLGIEWMFQGCQQGLSQDQIWDALAFEICLQSGEYALPVSQKEAEENLPTGPLEIWHATKLIDRYPEMMPGVRAWAYSYDPTVFYRFHP